MCSRVRRSAAADPTPLPDLHSIRQTGEKPQVIQPPCATKRPPRSGTRPDRQTDGRTDTDGRESPYEVKISLFDALRGTIANGADGSQTERYLCAHTILLALEGIPAFYIHSLLATENDNERREASGHARAVNRHQWKLDALLQALDDPESHHHQIFYELKRRIAIRKQQIAFHPNATQLTLHLGEQLFAFWRESPNRYQSIFAIKGQSK